MSADAQSSCFCTSLVPSIMFMLNLQITNFSVVNKLFRFKQIYFIPFSSNIHCLVTFYKILFPFLMQCDFTGAFCLSTLLPRQPLLKTNIVYQFTSPLLEVPCICFNGSSDAATLIQTNTAG